MKKALLVENIHPDAEEILRNSGFEVETRKGSLSADELEDALQGVSVLGIRSNTRLPGAFLKNPPESLLAIGAFCIGTNQIDLKAATRSGIAVFNAPFSNTRSVVELAMAEIVMLSRNLADHNAEMHAGIWNKSARGSHEVRQHTLGIVGYGHIGSQLSILAESFGMRVIYYDIADKLALGNAQRCGTLYELLSKAEFVSLHVDGRPGNAGFFGDEELRHMKPGAKLINLSRGFIVDTEALAEHLTSGHLGGAALDVFPTEPKTAGDPFVSNLQGMKNVILTPHIGGSTLEAQEDIGHYVAAKLASYSDTGSTDMSVNLPGIQVPDVPEDGRRVAYLHKNVPGVLANLNALLSEHKANIAYQSLKTTGEYGYAVTDVTYAEPGLVAQLRESPDTVRVRLI